MSRWSRLVPVCVVAVLLAACGGGGSDTPLAPSAHAVGPRLDGGLATGGNATDSVPATASWDPSTATLESDSTSRSGGLAVGGN
jgi:hypothetical protein